MIKTKKGKLIFHHILLKLPVLGDVLRKVVVEVLVHEDELESVVDSISRNALTGSAGQIGDGKIFVLPVAEVIDMADPDIGFEPVD